MCRVAASVPIRAGDPSPVQSVILTRPRPSDTSPTSHASWPAERTASRVSKRSLRGDDGQHAEAEVEHVLHLVVGDVAGGLDLGEDPGLVPRRRGAATASQCGGQHPGEVVGEAAAGDVRERVHVDPFAQLPHRGRVDHARADQLVAERVVRALPRGVVEAAAGAVEQRLAGERVAVAAQPRAGEADDDVARLHAAPGARARARPRRPRSRRGRTRPAP